MPDYLGMEQKRGVVDMDLELRHLITIEIRKSPKKRSQIAKEMSDILGLRVTESMLNDFTSESKKAVRFPLAFSAALCEVLDDDSVGLMAVRPRVRLMVEFALRELAALKDERERQLLRDELLKKDQCAE
jgi:hypothetical protein